MRTIKNLLVGLGLLILANLFNFQQEIKEMPSDTKKVIKWWLIVFLGVAVLRLLTGCVKPRQWVIPPVPIQSDTVYVGATTCDANNNPVIRINAKYYSDTLSIPYKRLLMHEKVHVRQAIYYGDCHAFLKRGEDPEFAFAVEAEAYCFVYNYEKDHGLEHLWSEDRIIELLASGTGFASQDVKAHLPCREGG